MVETYQSSEGKRLLISEIFGPTFQGEGVSLGKLCVFLRLGGCNLHCTWCDTPYTWDAKRYDLKTKLFGMRVMDVAGNLVKLMQHNPHRPVGRVVVSGGEPTLQGRALHDLVYMMDPSTIWEMETNGTHIPDMSSDTFDQYNVSVKLRNSDNSYSERIKPDAIEWFRNSGRSYWKFVVSSSRDFDEIDDLVRGYQLPHERVYIMPEGTDHASVVVRAQSIAEGVLDRGWNLTTRLHVLLWGNTPGR